MDWAVSIARIDEKMVGEPRAAVRLSGYDHVSLSFELQR